MFAGAAREAVFSNPDVIRRVNADFVPVALKAGLVNNPPDDEEGRLYREIGRSKIVPQGICVVNSAGKVLDWTVDVRRRQERARLPRPCCQRFAQFPDAKKPVAAERYMKFPSQKLADVADNGKVPVDPRTPSRREKLSGEAAVRQGTVVARVFGRALDKDGKPVADTVRQEHYVEDRFHVPVAMQEALAKALADAGTERFRLADDLARLLVSHAFLGQLDVNPLVERPATARAISSTANSGRRRSAAAATVLSGSASRASRRPREVRATPAGAATAGSGSTRSSSPGRESSR